MTPFSILIIEDEKYLRDLYAEILIDYSTKTVKDGFEALEKAKRYDLYIVDIGLPGMDGFKTIDKIKQIHGDIKTIIVTGYDVAGCSAELESGGVNGVLQKPFKVADLLSIVEEVLEG